MVESRVTVVSPVGLHARPAALLVQEAAKYDCHLILEYGRRRANAKSILQVLALGVKNGEEVRICAEGKGEEEAIVALERLCRAGLDA
ncbi:MAG: HPr family phosphocarrier protein [Bacillota bacterium]